VIRTTSGEPMRACVTYGYTIGSDPETAARANAATTASLSEAFARP